MPFSITNLACACKSKHACIQQHVPADDVQGQHSVNINTKMLSQASQLIKDASVLRRLEFAAGFYPPDLPNYYERVLQFATKGKENRHSLDPQQALELLDNMKYLDSQAFIPETELIKEIITMKHGGSDMSIGIILLSSKKLCANCEGKLYIRGDRAASVTLYSDTLGAVPATHFTRYCRKKSCSFQQHYGYYTKGNSEVHYDHDWSSNPYFMSTRETAFCMELLRRLDKEILIGQISYKQRAELYNDIHGEDTR